MQLDLIFHPSITHSSDYRLTCSNWKQRNADYVLLLIFHIAELSNDHRAPGDTHLCHDLGLMWPLLAPFSVPSWAQSVFLEGLTGKPFLKCVFSYYKIHTLLHSLLFFWSGIVAVMGGFLFSTGIWNSIICISLWQWSSVLCFWAKLLGLVFFCFWVVGGDNIVQVLRVKHIWKLGKNLFHKSNSVSGGPCI